MTNKTQNLRNITVDELIDGVAFSHNSSNETLTYAAGPDKRGCVIVTNSRGVFCSTNIESLFKKPIHILDGVPVYVGDMVYGKGFRVVIQVASAISDHTGFGVITETGTQSMLGERVPFAWDEVTTVKPKTKKLINVYATGVEHFDSLAEADENAKDGRLICIEVEL